MKRVDEYAIKRLHIPSLRLMENAGKAVVDELQRRLTSSKRSSKKNHGSLRTNTILILCGKGNNGGDGFAVARLLIEKQFSVIVVLMDHQKNLSGDARKQFDKLQNYDDATLSIYNFETFQKQKNKNISVIVDAMLGTSFRGELTGKYLKAATWSNKQSALKIAVDIPTGLNGETGEVLTDAFCADVTVTMSNPKIGFYRQRAKEFTGDVVVSEIGIPKKAISKMQSLRVPKQSERSNLKSEGGIHYSDNVVLTEIGDVRKTFPKRAINSHKHSVGKIFALAGSRSMMGAALLCSESAMRSGTGQVILGVPDSEYAMIAKRTLEVMPLGLSSTVTGSLSSFANEEIGKRIGWATVVLLGCGMSRQDETQELIRNIIRSCPKSMVIDADALHALIGNLDLLKKRKSKHIVLTPHYGEFSRLIGISSAEVESNRFSLASNFAKKYGLTLVLKGAPTIVADPKGKIMVNDTGNPGMSTAGSGDVLAGIIASFIGQGNSASNAAVNGVWIHGAAGDMAKQKIGMYGMLARDIMHFVPTAIHKVMTI